MGVHGLWDIVGPTARPVRLEAMSKKRLAVDASIWIYQFLKAVRDKQGNQLINSHIVGFFRRICKLLYFGIRPVFVFDGGAPILKRQTIVRRREKREGNKQTAEQMAKNLLARQLQNRAEQRLSSPPKSKPKATFKEVSTDKLQGGQYYEDNNYFDTREKPKEPAKKDGKMFRRQDEYDLPQLDSFKVEKNDQRMITDYEYERLTSDLQDELGGIDLETIDPKSADFARLPLSTQYIVLSHLRLRSRLRMGYTKQQLETLFPDSMDFSKFQIQMVQKRNFLTQRLMNVAGMDDIDPEVQSRRIASDRDRMYELKRNENGYTLSIDDNGQSADQAIDLDSDNDDEDLEDVLEDVTDITPSGPPLVKAQVSKPVRTVSESVSNPIFVGEVETEEKDEDQTMAMIQSLYDYANTNNAGVKQAKEMSEEDQLREAIERSKQDYYNMVEQEENEEQKDPFDFGPAPPLILSEQSLGTNMDKVTNKNVDIPKFDFKNSLFASDSKKQEKQETPIWFQQKLPERIHDDVSQKTQAPEQTEDEKAGLYHYDDIENYLEPEIESEDEEVDLAKSSSPEAEIEDLTSKGDEEDPIDLDLEDVIEERHVQVDQEAAQKKRVDVDLEEVAEKKPIDIQDLEPSARSETPEVSKEPESARFESPEESNEVPSVESEEPVSESSKQENQPEILDYVFSDEEELEQNLENEEAAYEKFVGDVKSTRPVKSSGSFWSMDDEVKLQENLKKQKRDADEVTVKMVLDVQDLLSRFGLPYITAPMEAEAQCAELLRLNLVDGIITDDSDCFLFGGDRVYKNMFNEKNFVECYQMEDLERDMGLNRQILIEIALLLGSDYTDGIKGVGKVAAMEILAEFKSLENFKQWWLKYQDGHIDESTETSIKRKLRKTLKKTGLFLTPEFPDKRVIDAYLHPEVDHDKTEFKWGYPNLDKLRAFLMYNVGWNDEKVDSILLPIIQNMNKPQTSIEEFFPVEMVRRRRELAIGQRLKNATSRLRNGDDSEPPEMEQQPAQPKKRRKRA